MHESVKAFVLRFFKVPPEPEAPAGSPASVRIFRAASNFYKLNLIKWGFAQAAATLGVLIFFIVDLVANLPPHLTIILRIVESIGLLVLLIQIPMTYFLIRLDYEMRWYIVTDRSLRIRHGVQNVREMTMTFANVQQITVRQGPLQRFLGIADLQVRTAGGGGGPNEGGAGHGQIGESMHLGYFRGVANAGEIRDLILERMRRLRDAGLGDPDDVADEETARTSDGAEVLEAAQELLQETRAMRQAFS